MALPNDDQVRFDVLIEAKAAMNSLREFLKITDDNSRKVVLFSEVVMRQSKLMGVHWTQLLGVYKQLNAEMSKSHKPTLFGNVGGKDLFGDASKLMQGWQDAGRVFDDLGAKSTQAGQKMSNAGKQASSGWRSALESVNLVRIALGALVAMLLFNVISAIQTTFRKAIELATQYEDTLYRLRNVEQSLSLNGIEISMKGLQKGIADIQKLLPIFSKEDVSQLVGTLAISTKQLGLNEQQILDLAKAIGILNIRSEKQEELSVTAQHVLSSVLTGNAKGITALGIAFTDNVMRAKAMELGFLKAGDALSELSENEKGLTKLGIILESTGTELANVGGYLDSNSAKLQQNKAAWNDLLTTLGQVILPFIPALTGFFQLINDGLNGGKVLLIEFMTVLGTLGVVMAGVFSGRITTLDQFTDTVKTSIETLREALVNKLFSEVPENAPEWFKKGWGNLIKEEAETATSGIDAFQEAVDEFDASEFSNEIEKILEDAERAREDLEKKLDQKKEDLDLEYLRKAEDAEKDYLRKIDDINRDAERDLRNLKDKHREEDVRAEQDYQNKLWELRMRYLMNLEDALHARDARQVIRLMKEYAIDKEALERKKNLEDKQREEDQKDEIAEIEQRRQERIEDARIEYEQKLADQRLAKQRELDDLNVWYEREQADLQQNLERKLQALIDAGIEEGKITEANAAQVYGILYKYFGPGGMTDALYAYMRQQLSQPIPIPLPGGMPAPYWDLAAGNENGTKDGRTPVTGEKGGKKQTSNNLLARPSNTIFGSGASTLPLNRIGRDTGKFSGSGAGNTGMEGLIRMELLLSPDLEARVVENTMNGVADIIVKVTDSK